MKPPERKAMHRENDIPAAARVNQAQIPTAVGAGSKYIVERIIFPIVFAFAAGVLVHMHFAEPAPAPRVEREFLAPATAYVVSCDGVVQEETIVAQGAEE